jgi:hypothetical protein
MMSEKESWKLLRRKVRQGVARWRLQNCLSILTRLTIIIAIAAALLNLSVYYLSFGLSALPFIGVSAVFLVIGVTAWGWGTKLDRSRLFRIMDHKAGLPDTIRSAMELRQLVKGGWRYCLLQQSAQRLKVIDWKSVWPVQIPRVFWLAFFCLIVLSAGLNSRYQAYADDILIAGESTKAEEKVEDLKAIFQEWESRINQSGSEEMKNMMEELAPMREKLKEGDLSDKEMMLELSRMEDRLEEMAAELNAQSLESAASELAEAFEPVEGLSGLAAALRKKEFEKALAEALEAAREFEDSDSPRLDAKNRDAAAERFSKLEEKFQQQQDKDMAQAMKGMKEGAKSGSSDPMSKAMDRMGRRLAQQSAADKQQQGLQKMMKQLGMAKSQLGKGMNIGQGLSMQAQAGRQPSDKPGSQAGSADGDNPFGDPTQLGSNRVLVKVEGMLGEGDSETFTLRAEEGRAEGNSSISQAQFRRYEKQSQQAIENENLPFSHRQSIKRYFESIRPNE